MYYGNLEKYQEKISLHCFVDNMLHIAKYDTSGV
jgi:hypothetical protein